MISSFKVEARGELLDQLSLTHVAWIPQDQPSSHNFAQLGPRSLRVSRWTSVRRGGGWGGARGREDVQLLSSVRAGPLESIVARGPISVKLNAGGDLPLGGIGPSEAARPLDNQLAQGSPARFSSLWNAAAKRAPPWAAYAGT